MLIDFKRGQGSIIIRVKILDSSVSTGAGKTGLAYNTSGLIISTIADNESSPTVYTVAASNVEDITTLGTFAAPTSGKCRFKEVHSTNHKGVYEIQIADARYAVSAAKSLLISISGAANAAECDATIPLRDFDLYSATPDVNLAKVLGNAPPTPNTDGVLIVDERGGQVFKLDAATGTTMTLPSTASSVDHTYRGCKFSPIAGTAKGMAGRVCSGYVGSTRVATFTGVSNWPTTPDSTTYVKIESAGADVHAWKTGGVQTPLFTGVPQTDLVYIRGTALTETVAGYLAAGFKKLFDVVSPVFTLASVNQTGDAYPGANRLTAARAGYIDNLSQGPAATSDQLNSAVWAQTRFRFSIPERIEVPESGSTVFVFGITTYNAAGVLTDCDSPPTVAAYYVDGTSASGLISGVTRDGVGIYQFSLTLPSGTSAPTEVRFIGTALMSSQSIGMTDYTWIMNDIAPDFSSSDRAKLEAIHGKLPSKSYLTGTSNSDGDVQLDEATGTLQDVTLATSQPNYAPSQAGDQMTLTSDYDAAKTAASQTSVDSLGSPLQSGSYTAPDNSTIAAIAAKFTGITSVADWLRRLVRKDAGTSGMGTAQSEINTGGTATFDGTTDSLEAIKDATGAGGGGDCPTADQIGDDIESRFTGRALIIPSPLGGNKVKILGGCDYENETFFLEIPKPANATWPDLSDGQWNDIRFVARIAGEDIPIGTGSVVTPTGSSAKVKIAFTNAETDQLRQADGENDVCTVWAVKSGKRCTLFHRELEVVQTAWAEAGT